MGRPLAELTLSEDERGERDFPNVTVPPLDPDNRMKEW